MEVDEPASRLIFCGGSAGRSENVIHVISSENAPSPLALKADTQNVYSVNSRNSVTWYCVFSESTMTDLVGAA